MLNLPNKNEINTLPLVLKGNMLGISFHAQCQGETKLFAASFMYHLRVENDDDRMLKKSLFSILCFFFFNLIIKKYTQYCVASFFNLIIKVIHVCCPF